MEFTAEFIAQMVHGAVEGDPQVKINTFAKIEEGVPGAISFLANPKYTQYIYDTQSSAVLVRKDFVAERPISATLIRVDDPYATIASLLDMAAKAGASNQPTGIEEPAYVAQGVDLPADAYVGAFSYVGSGAKVGAGVKIYPQCYVGPDVELGDGTVLYPGVKVYAGCKIGSRCIVHSGAVIGADGFGFAPQPDGHYEKIPQLGIVEIGDDVEIGANTTVDRAVMGSTRIEKGVKLDNLIQIAHNVVVGENTVMAAQVGIAGSSKIGKQCMLGGQAGIAGHIAIGDNSQIGAQAGIPKSVKAGSRLLGTPAVDFLDFAKQAALLRRLPSLFDKVSEIGKELEEKQ